MTSNQLRLLENHEDLAQLTCTGENKVFWVLDLCDEAAFRIAEGFQSRETLIANREKEISRDHIPAITLASTVQSLNSYRVEIMGAKPLPDPPDEMIYLVVCTDGRIACAAIPAFSKT
jgi:hypothetical protein